MTTASPTFVFVNSRGCKPSGSSGAGVSTSAAFTTMSHDNIFVNSAFFFLDGHHGNGVLRPVHARANYFGHSGIGFDKFVPVLSGIYHINRRCHDCAGICDEICAGFHFPDATCVRSVPRSFQRLRPCGARLSANLWIPRPACARPCTRPPGLNAVAFSNPTQIFKDINANALPYFGIAARPDMRVHGRDGQIALFANFMDVGDVLMPDPQNSMQDRRHWCACCAQIPGRD